MRKGKNLLIAAILVALLTGCSMKVHTGFEITSDKKVSIRSIEAMDVQAIDTMIKFGNSTEVDEDSEAESNSDDGEEITVTDEMRWEYLKESIEEELKKDEMYKDAKFEKYDDGTYKGYTVTKELGTLDELSTESATERVSISDENFIGQKMFIKKGNTYTSNLAITSEAEDMESVSQYQAMGAIFDIKFVVVLPSKSISNNADAVSEDGLTLSWDLMKKTATYPINLDFAFEVKDASISSSNALMYAGIIGLVVIIVVIVLVIVSSKKKAKAVTNDNEASTTPAEVQETHEEVHEIPEETEEAQPVQENQEVQGTQNEDNLKTCPNCGQQASSHFCVNCGTKID